MNTLTLNLKKDDLLELMKNFNTLTGIKIALFDAEGNEILSYPDKHCPFCAYVRSIKKGADKCLESNKKSFERSRKTGTLEIFKCHAGLIETTVPLLDNGAVIAYIMFGQITDNASHKEIAAILRESVEKIQPSDKGLDASIYNVTYKTEEQIMAAARILEACTFYVLLKDMISLQRENFMQNLNGFLISHLSEDLSVERLMNEFHISKNKLYDSCNKYLSTGIAEHIKLLRIEEARRLLKETDFSVNHISDLVGFNDYNYFCRVFKQKTGISALKYRKSSES